MPRYETKIRAALCLAKDAPGDAALDGGALVAEAVGPLVAWEAEHGVIRDWGASLAAVAGSDEWKRHQIRCNTDL